MLAYQQRVIDEQTALDENRYKLDSFINSDMFTSLEEVEQDRLRQQAAIMKEYSGILGDRIIYFVEKNRRG